MQTTKLKVTAAACEVLAKQEQAIVRMSEECLPHLSEAIVTPCTSRSRSRSRSRSSTSVPSGAFAPWPLLLPAAAACAKAVSSALTASARQLHHKNILRPTWSF